MNYTQAIQAAEGLIEILSPVFKRLEIAGSIRRASKSDYDEIDLVGIPDLTPPEREKPRFGFSTPKAYATKLDKSLDLLASVGSISISQNGPRGKRFFSHLYRIRVDLNVVIPPATWGVIFLTRTGPRDFSHWVVTRRNRGGALPIGYRVQDGAVFEGEYRARVDEGIVPIGFDSEESFLDWLGLGWIDPGDRVARWGEFGGRSHA